MSGGYVIGGQQYATNEASTAEQVSVANTDWGYAVENDSIIAQGYTWTPQYSWGASYINLFYTADPSYIATDLGIFGSLAVTGGRQQFSNLDSSAPWFEGAFWGSRSTTEVILGYTQAWHPTALEWGNSIISLYLDLVAARTGYQILGGVQWSSNISTSQPWVEHHRWGEPSPDGVAVEIGTTKAWTPQYGWGNSRIVIFLL